MRSLFNDPSFGIDELMMTLLKEHLRRVCHEICSSSYMYCVSHLLCFVLFCFCFVLLCFAFSVVTVSVLSEFKCSFTHTIRITWLGMDNQTVVSVLMKKSWRVCVIETLPNFNKMQQTFAWVITPIMKCEMKLFIHIQTSTAAPLKFGNG